MIARRTLILFTAASLGLTATGAQASEELLGDILRGVADALTRDYIRKHYREGRSHQRPIPGRSSAADFGDQPLLEQSIDGGVR